MSATADGMTAEPSLCLQRLMRDFRKMKNEQRAGLEASPNPTNIMQWNAVMSGPEDTPWDGGDHLPTLLPGGTVV